MEDLKVSIITAAYNAENFLGRTLESAIGQTYKNIEHIVIDDGSKDGTIDVLRKYQNRYNLKFVSKKNGGQSNALNYAVSLADGHFVAFLDHDDEWAPEKIEKQVDMFLSSNNPKLGIVACDGLAVIRKNAGETPAVENIYMPRNWDNRYDLLNQILAFTPVHMSGVMVKTTVFKDCCYFDSKIRWGVDWDVVVQLLGKYEFDFVSEPLFYYNIEGQNTTTNMSQEAILRDMAYLTDKHNSMYIQHPDAYIRVMRMIGLGYLRVGKNKIARNYFMKSIRTTKKDIRAYVFWLFSFLGWRSMEKLLMCWRGFLHITKR